MTRRLQRDMYESFDLVYTCTIRHEDALRVNHHDDDGYLRPTQQINALVKKS